MSATSAAMSAAMSAVIAGGSMAGRGSRYCTLGSTKEALRGSQITLNLEVLASVLSTNRSTS